MLDGKRINLIACICKNCGSECTKSAAEVKRANAKGTSLMCSLSCSAKFRNKLSLESKIKSGESMLAPFQKFVRSAKSRDGECTITADILYLVWKSQNGICPFTGGSMILRDWTGRGNYGSAVPNQASLDRIDSCKGYVAGNVRFISHIANICKSVWSDDEVRSFCHDVVENDKRMMVIPKN